MPKTLKRLLWLLGGLATLGFGVVTYAYTWGLVPYKPDISEFDLFLDFSPEARAAMEPVVVGGHFFIFDGQDIWMRFKRPDVSPGTYPDLDALVPDFSESWSCEPEEMEIVQGWFLKRLSQPDFVAGLTPWSDLAPQDRRSLEDTTQLDCIYMPGVSSSLRALPSTCNHWWLHNRQTGFVYVRWACYNG